MTWRTSTKNGANLVHIEPLRADEQPPAIGSAPARPERDALGRFRAGNTIGKAKRLRASLSAFRTDPRFAPFQRWGARYGAHRRRELARAHGGEISAGVGAIIESAAQAMAASRFLQGLAAETADAELFKQSSSLASTARQHELAAWELAAREADARRKADPAAAHRRMLEAFGAPEGRS